MYLSCRFQVENSVHFNSSSTLDAINSQNLGSFLLDGYTPGDPRKDFTN